jgi:hypothetical protein
MNAMTSVEEHEEQTPMDHPVNRGDGAPRKDDRVTRSRRR